MSNNRNYIQELKKLLIDTDSVDVVDNIKEAHYELQLDSQVAFWKSLLSKSKLEFNPISDDSLKDDDCHINELVTRFMANRSGINHMKIAAPLDKFEHCYLCVQIERDDSLFIGVFNDPSEKNTALKNVLPIEGYQSNKNYDWWPVYKYIHFDEYWTFKNLRPEQIKNLHDKSYIDKFTDHIVGEMKLLKSKLCE